MKKLFLLFLILPFLWFSCSGGTNDKDIDKDKDNDDDNTVIIHDDDDEAVSITLDHTSISLYIGKTRTLTATISNATNKTRKWETSNAAVATVTQAGVVTAVDLGKATITVTSNADTTKKALCQVEVKERPVTDIGTKDGMTGLSAEEYFAQKNVFVGWNLGNAFDAPAYGSWTKKINQEFLQEVKDAGFSIIRIPVTWNTNIGAAPTYTINLAYMNQVQEVVDWAYEAGLVTIINIHHDGSQNGTTFNASSTSWLSTLRLKQNQTERNNGVAKFTKVWEQIAATFKDYGDWLIFEPFNELHNGGWGWGDNINQTELDIITQLNQTFTDTVRASGGNNATRFLVVQPYCAKPHMAMKDSFIIPTDTGTNAHTKQIISMHYYEPENFAIVNGGTGSPNWGSSSDKLNIDNAFNEYADKFTKNHYPLILGECGPTYQNRSDATQRNTAHANRITYIEYVYDKAKSLNIVPVYWDNGTIYASAVGENFGLWDRRPQGDLKVFPETEDKPGMQIIIDTMIKAVN